MTKNKDKVNVREILEKSPGSLMELFSPIEEKINQVNPNLKELIELLVSNKSDYLLKNERVKRVFYDFIKKNEIDWKRPPSNYRLVDALFSLIIVRAKLYKLSDYLNKINNRNTTHISSVKVGGIYNLWFSSLYSLGITKNGMIFKLSEELEKFVNKVNK